MYKLNFLLSNILIKNRLLGNFYTQLSNDLHQICASAFQLILHEWISWREFCLPFFPRFECSSRTVQSISVGWQYQLVCTAEERDKKPESKNYASNQIIKSAGEDRLLDHYRCGPKHQHCIATAITGSWRTFEYLRFERLDLPASDRVETLYRIKCRLLKLARNWRPTGCPTFASTNGQWPEVNDSIKSGNFQLTHTDVDRQE